MTTKQYGLVIDLHRCVGCAACDIACKSENNVTEGFHWSNHVIETRGSFPNTSFRYIPILCNHCDNAPCVANCPTSAMYKSEDGLTLNDPDRCIGCRACQVSCPYGAIYFNEERPHRQFSDDDQAMIPGATASAKEVADEAGAPIPYYNPDGANSNAGLRPKGVVEKCTLCEHRLGQGEEPWCVASCPTGARIFGDLADPDSAPRRAIAKHTPKVRQPEKGTRPNVYYIREF